MRSGLQSHLPEDNPSSSIIYAVNPDKTDKEVLTAYLNCDKGHACHQMLATKEAKNNRDGVQYYHILN